MLGQPVRSERASLGGQGVQELLCGLQEFGSGRVTEGEGLTEAGAGFLGFSQFDQSLSQIRQRTGLFVEPADVPPLDQSIAQVVGGLAPPPQCRWNSAP